MKETIFPTDKILLRPAKEGLLNQRGVIIWFTGLSGSGKTTIAIELEKALFERGLLTQVLDGDNMRMGLNNNLDFSEEGRTENIRRIAETALLFLNCGIVTICCCVSPARSMRKLAREIIGAADFMEVFLSTPLSKCEERDVKGLYAKARKGELPSLTGVGSAYEVPDAPTLSIDTSDTSVETSVDRILHELRLNKEFNIHD
jgi:adenylylsulfate kinase